VRFSALIPTKDRLSLLRLAVQSVRDQDYDDWEIVVSDNAPAGPALPFFESLQDPRVGCTRTDAVYN
jgi:hypothetical protein